MSHFEIIENEYQEEILKIKNTLSTSIRNIKNSAITDKLTILKILLKRYDREKTKIKAMYTSKLVAHIRLFNTLKIFFSRRNSFKVF